MDLRQLAALTAVADHRSFSAAARALHTVQSNVSTHVARLERELGATPRRPGHRPAHRGRRDRGRAGPAGSRPSSTPSPPTWPRRSARSRARSASASSAPPAAGWCRRCSPRWPRRHPKVRLVIVDATTTSLIPQLAAGRLDLAVVNLPVADPDVEVEVLFEEDHVVLVARRPPARRPRAR